MMEVMCSKGARFRRQKLVRLFFLLLIVKVSFGFILWRLASRYSLAAQIIDILGLPSTVYMGGVSCDHCNSFYLVYHIEPQLYPVTLQPVFLLNLVVSHVDNFERRQAIRNTWGSVREHHGKQIQTFFILGSRSSKVKTTSIVINDLQQHEASTYGDIVQLNLKDDYRYLTNKTMGALRWASSRYPDATFLLKSDDDSFNAIPRFVEHLINRNPNGFVGGMCSSGEEPHRNPSSKWHIPKEVYSGDIYPIHAKGRAYIISQDAARKILAVSINVQFNPLEDLFVTGFCRAMAGLSCTHIAQIPNQNEAISNCDVATFVFNVHHVQPNALLKMWKIYGNKISRRLACASGKDIAVRLQNESSSKNRRRPSKPRTSLNNQLS